MDATLHLIALKAEKRALLAKLRAARVKRWILLAENRILKLRVWFRQIC
jgi:hypothetical protein